MIAFLIRLVLQTCGDFDLLVDELSSDEVELRESAQVRIERLPPEILPALRKRLEREMDPEVCVRLRDSIGRMERRLFVRHHSEKWEQGDLDGALLQLALSEGARDPIVHVASRKQEIRRALSDSWLKERGCSWFRSLDQWADRLKVNRRWMLAVLLEWALDDAAGRLYARSTLYLLEEGAGVVPVIIPRLKEGNLSSRQVGCILLGNLRDDRAIPELERLCRDPEELPELRKVAQEAYRKCARRPAPSPDAP